MNFETRIEMISVRDQPVWDASASTPALMYSALSR